MVIPKGFPMSVGRVKSRLLGFPYPVISMACFRRHQRFPEGGIAIRMDAKIETEAVLT